MRQRANTPTRIILTGPESSGKTTLAESLARELDTRWTPEYARTYLEGLGRPYDFDDLLAIAREQWAAQENALQQVERFLVCDTGMAVIQVWSTYRYGKSHPWIEERLAEQQNDLFLLCRPDLPWQPDPLRENPHDRHNLFDRYLEVLHTFHLNFAVIEGARRLEMALEAVRQREGF